MRFETLLYDVAGPLATITLNRPERLNTIVPPMPDEFEAAVREATLDPAVKVIVLRGAGRSFCAGYDFAGGFHHWDDMLTTDGRWDPGKDFAWAASPYGPTQKFLSIWRTHKPVIAQIHGWCVGGGSDMALAADLIIASEDAQIGTPYSRIWGCYLSGMWVYRLGLTKAKEHALTGKPLSGREAADAELINAAVPFESLEATVAERCVAPRGGGGHAGGPRCLDEGQAVRRVAHQPVEDRAERLGRAQAHVLVGLVDDQLHRGEL